MMTEQHKTKKKFSLSNSWFSFLMTIPTLLVLCGVFLYPLGYSLLLSFQRWSFRGTTFIGIDNYLQILQDPVFWNSLKVTVIFWLSALASQLIIGFILAYLISLINSKWAKNILRTIFIMPLMLNPVVVGLVWRSMFNYESGIINYFLNLIGISSYAWASMPDTAILALLVVEIWNLTPFVFLIFSAGMESLPISPYESVEIDGANEWQKVRYLTIPLLRPLFMVVLIFRSMALFQIFDKVYSLTGGGPGEATRTLSYDIFSRAFGAYQFGYSAALSWIMLVISLLIGLYIIKKATMEIY